MNKVWRVFWYEYSRHVMRWRFFFGLMSMPLLIVFVLLIGFLSVFLSTDYTPMGYVDQSGLLANPLPLPTGEIFFDKPVDMIPFSSEEDAKAALDAKKIQAYYVLPPDYYQTATVRLVSLKQPESQIESQFRDFLRINILAGQDPTLVKRLNEGSIFYIQSVDGKRQMSEKEWFNILIPFVAGLLFFIVIMSSGGYLMQAVVEEKENRTMEIIVTSVSPTQLMTGKIIGNLSVGLTQLLGWTLFTVAAILIGRNYFDWMRAVSLNAEYLWVMALTMLPAFVLVAALMAMIGATVTDSREAQQISGLFTLPIVIPYWFIYPIMTNPNGPLAVGLSFFPMTAPITLTLRAAFTQIPTWQLAINISTLFLFAAGAIWLAGRTFRLGMLRYGKRLSWREIFSKAG